MKDHPSVTLMFLSLFLTSFFLTFLFVQSLQEGFSLFPFIILIKISVLLSRHRLRTFPISPQRCVHPRILRRHTWHAPQLLLPHSWLAHPRQPHTQILQRLPGEEGGCDPNPAQVSFICPTAAEGCQSAPARPEECKVQDRVHLQPEAPAKRRTGNHSET